MASRTLDVTLNGKDNLSPAFQKAGDAAKSLGDSLEGLGKGGGLDGFLSQIQSLDSEIRTVGQALTGFGVAVTAGVAVGVKQFADLEAAMANVSTIAGQSDAWIANMTTQIRGLAVELGTSPTGLAEGLYDLIGSGIDSADALDVLRVSAVAAKAGLTDTGTAARAITSVLNAYGLAADEAGHISDVLFRTVDSGVISFEELSGSLGRALPLANLLSVSIEELGAAYAELTRNGLNAAEAETSFTALLTAAINPTEALTKAVQEHGYASAEAMIQTEGFTAFLQFLWDVSGGSAAAMSELTGNVRATNGALILAQDGASGFTDRLVEMESASGATSAAFERQMDTLNASLARARAGFNDLAITVGAAVAPAIDAGANAMSGWAATISSLPDGLQTVASVATAAAGGVALFAGGLLLTVPRIAETVTALRALAAATTTARAAMAGMAASTGIWAAALTAGAGAGVALGGFLGEIYVSMRDGESATKAFSDATNILAAAMDKLRSGDFIGFFDTLINGIDQASDAMEAFNTTIGSLWDEAARQQLLGNDAVAEGMQQLVAETSSMIKIADEYVGSAEFQARAMQEVVLAGVTQEQAIANLTEAYTQNEAELALYNEAVETLGRAFLDPSVNADELNARLDSLAMQFYAGNITLDQYREGLVELAREYGDLPNDASAAADAIASVADASNIAGGALTTLTGNMLDNADAAEKERERIQKLKEEWISAALAVAGWDNALSQLNMTGLTGEVGLFAEEWTRANQAMDNTFRIIVGNTNAIISQVDGIQSWADELINVQGELGKIDDLLEGGFIDADQYAAAQTAYDGISTSVSNIRNNLLAVQAIQAPFIAEVVAGTEQWAAELRQMPADVQRTTLAFMDLQTVQQAQELITLGNSEAFKAMGDSGTAAFEATIRGALQVNPLLFNVLETMGIISGTPLDFEVNYDALEGAGSAIEQLTTQVGYLVDTLRQIYGLPPIEIETNVAGVEQAQTQVEAVLNTVQQADGTDAYMVMTVNAETGELETAGEIIDSVLSADGKTANVTIETTGGEVVEGIIDMATGDITMNVNINPTIAGVSLGSGQSLSSLASSVLGGDGGTVDIPATITPDTSALDTALAGYEGQTISVDIVIGTNELDTGLTGWGLGTGGGGGAAGYEHKTVTVDVLANTDQAATDIASLLALVTMTGTATVNVDADVSAAETAITGLTMNTSGKGYLTTVYVNADTSSAESAIAALTDTAGGMPDSISVTVTALTEGAVAALDNVTAAAQGIPESESVTVTALAEGATAALNGVTAAADGIPESESVTVSVYGADSAIGALNSVANAAASIPSSVSTTITTNRVTNNIATYSTVGAAGGGFMTSQHGGIPSYATGGVLFRGAEGNRPEIAHFATGGTALLPRDGLYMAPPMTYISPHNSGGSAGGDTYQGDTIELHVHGNVYAIDELAEAMEGALMRRRRAYGLAVQA